MSYIDFMNAYLPHVDCADCMRNNTYECDSAECLNVCREI